MKKIDLNFPKKSHQAWNKGLKGTHFSPKTEFKKGNKPMCPFQKGVHNSINTEFKKGRTPHNKCPIGTIRKRKTGTSYGYDYFIKIAEPNKWITVWQKLWIDIHGEIPNGCVIHHINKNHFDNRIENLVCVTKSEHIEIHRKDLQNAKRRTL